MNLKYFCGYITTTVHKLRRHTEIGKGLLKFSFFVETCTSLKVEQGQESHTLRRFDFWGDFFQRKRVTLPAESALEIVYRETQCRPLCLR